MNKKRRFIVFSFFIFPIGWHREDDDEKYVRLSSSIIKSG
jgi:hypothetical protein